MTTFKACVRNQRADGFYVVYIRVTHNRELAWIRTDKMVSRGGLNRQEIVDPYVLGYCSNKIVEYNDRLNRHDTSRWSVHDVVRFLKEGDEDISFSEFARKHIDRMIDGGQERNAKNYRLALQHLERFMGTESIMISQMTSKKMTDWVKSLDSTHRAKEMYPICMRQVYKAALMEYNDYDSGIIRIRTNPWPKVGIPSADRPEKRAITPEACRVFFSAPLPEAKMKEPLTELGRDVALMVLCLAGINTIDLYKMRKKDFSGGIIRYHRSKTRKFRSDGAYMEMRVPPIIQPLFDKYLDADENDEHLFKFHRRMSTSDSFSANVNRGIRQLCRSMGIPNDEWYCVYTFRHTWGTVAQNDVRASLDDVAFAMNHSSGHRMTSGYIKFDYSKAWELNEKVIDFIFFSDKPSTAGRKPEEDHFRLSYRYMVYAAAYYGGKKVAELNDVGFNNVDEVINRLMVMIPEDVPRRSVVMFKIVNMDKDQTVIYQRQVRNNQD